LRLALALGCTQGELLDRMTSEEWTEWQAFDAMEPIGAWRDDYNAGMLMALLANVNRKRGSQAFKPLDFMPFVRDDDYGKLTMDPEDSLGIWQAMAAATKSKAKPKNSTSTKPKDT
jgi:hypothetical protein